MELIDKAALVAKIEKRIKYYQAKNQKWDVAGYAGRVAEGEEILNYINTLKGIEVDLKKEYEKYYEQERYIQTFKLAKHFFELGLRAQKGE